MKKSFIKTFMLGVVFSMGFFVTAFMFIKAASLQATSGSPLTAGNWNDMISNFFWGSGSGGIFYNGKVGIGTNAPNKDLHIYDTTNNAEIDLQSVAGTNKHWAIYQDKTNSNLYMWSNQNNVAITSGGNMDVLGKVNGIGGLCINGNCKTAWSQVVSTSTNYTGTCDSSHKGATGIISNIYKICDGSAWLTIQSLAPGAVAKPGISCKEILTANPSSTSGVYWLDPTGGDTSDEFQAYCDMTTDGGGWTLVGTIAKTQTPISLYSSVPTTIALTPTDPSTTGIWKHSVSAFTDVREQVSCYSAGCKTVRGTSKSITELDKIRQAFVAYDSRVAVWPLFSDAPSCRLTYAGTDNVAGCTPHSGADTNTVAGWQCDANNISGGACWSIRGAGAGTQGSSTCGGNPDGTRRALLWFR